MKTRSSLARPFIMALTLLCFLSSLAYADTTAPSVSFTTPSPGSNPRPTISATLSDTGSGIDWPSFRFLVNGQDQSSVAVISSSVMTYTPGFDLSEGSHRVLITVKDLAGNVTTQDSVFVIDATAPRIFVSPVDSAMSPKTKPKIVVQLYEDSQASGPDMSQLVCLLNGQPIEMTIEGNTASYVPSTDLAKTNHVIDVTAKDLAGNTQSIQSQFSVDAVVPIISSTLPATNGVIVGARPRVSVHYSDNGVIDPGSATLTLNGVNYSEFLTSSQDQSVLNLPIDQPGLKEGIVNAQFSISDFAGNVVNTSWTFVLDNSRPTISSTIQNNSVSNNSTPVIQIDYSDSLSAINLQTLQIQIDNVDRSSEFTVTANSATLDLSTSEPLAEGQHSLTLSIQDAVGHTGYGQIFFTVDQSAPILTVTPGDGLGLRQLRPTLRIRLSESLANIDLTTAKILIDGVNHSSALVSSGQEFQWTPSSNLSQGSHSLLFQVTDRAGNQATYSGTFITETSAQNLSLELSPGQTSAIPINVSQNLTLSARTSSGLLVNDFSGVILLTCNDVSNPIHGQRFTFTEEDRGEKVIPVTFQKAGPLQINAVVESQGSILGSMQFSVTTQAVILYPITAPSIASAPLTIEGSSFSSIPVDIYVDGQLNQQVTAAQDGRFTATLSLTAGTFQIYSQASSGGQVYTSETRSVDVQTRPALSSSLPDSTNQGVFQLDVLALANTAVQLKQDGVVTLSKTADANGAVSFTVIYLANTGTHDIQFAMTVEGEELLSPVYKINLDHDKPSSPAIKTPVMDLVSPDPSILVTGDSPEAGHLYVQRDQEAPINAGPVNGSFEITVPLDLQIGFNSVKFWFVDSAGNSSLAVTRNVHFGADLIYGRIRSANLAGQLKVLPGATVLALDANGQLTADTVSLEGGFFALTRGNASSLKVVSEVLGLEELIYDLKSGENNLSLVLGLKRNNGVALSLDAQSTTTVSATATTLDGGASITIPAGVTLQSNASPELRIWRADPSALKTTFPGDTLLSALYKLSPHGTLSGPGATLKLPNVNNYKPGQGQIVYIFHDGADSAAPKDSNGVSSHLGHISADGKHIVVEGLDAFSTIGINAQVAAQNYVVNGVLSLPTRPDTDVRLVLSNGQSITLAPFQGQKNFNIPISYLPGHPLNLRVETSLLGFPVQLQSPTVTTPNLFTDIDMGTITVGLELKHSSFASSATQVHSSAGTQSFQVVIIGDSLNQFSANSGSGLVPATQNLTLIQTTPLLTPLNSVVNQGFVISGHVGPNETVTIFSDSLVIADSVANATDFTFQDIVGTNQRVFVYTPPSPLFATGQAFDLGVHTIKYKRALGVESPELQLTVVSPTPPAPGASYTFDIRAGTGFNSADPYFSVFEIEFNKAIKDEILVDLGLSEGYALRLRRASDVNSALGIRAKKISSSTIRVMVLEHLEEDTDYELILGSGLKSIDDEVLPQNPDFPTFQFRTGLDNAQLEDSLGPQLTVLSPALGVGPQAASSPIKFRLEDTLGRAVHLSSMSIEIHVDVLDAQGQVIARQIHYRGSYHDSFSYYGSARDAIVEIEPSGIIAPGSDVKVVVFASDIDGHTIRNSVPHPDASAHPGAYIFNYSIVNDSVDPIITLLEPSNYLTYTQTPLTPLRFQVTDDNAGVDLQRLKITIDGLNYSLHKQYEVLPSTTVADAVIGAEPGALHFSFPKDAEGNPDPGHYPRYLPFVFPYNGKGIEKIRIYPHGYLDLATQFTDIPLSDSYPNQVELQNHPRLAPFWTRLKNVEVYSKLGTDSQAVRFYDIRWDAETAPYIGNSTTVSFSVRMFEDGRIAYRYLSGLSANPGDDSHVLQGLSDENGKNSLVISDKAQWSMQTLELTISTTSEFKNVTKISNGYIVDIEPVIPLQSPSSNITVQAFDRNKPVANDATESFALNVSAPTTSQLSAPTFLSIRSGDRLDGPISISLIGLADPHTTVIITGYRGQSWRAVANGDGIFNYQTPDLIPGAWTLEAESHNAIGQVSAGKATANITIIKRGVNPNDPDSSNSPLSPPTNLNQSVPPIPADGIKPEVFVSHRNNWTWSAPTKSLSNKGYTSEQTRTSRHLLHAKKSLVRSHDNDDRYLTYFRVDRSPKLQNSQQNIVAFKGSVIRLKFAIQNPDLSAPVLGRIRYQVIQPAGATFTNGLDTVVLKNEDSDSEHNTLGPEFYFDGVDAVIKVTDLDGHYTDEAMRSREVRITPASAVEENQRLFIPTVASNNPTMQGQTNQIQSLHTNARLLSENINLPYQLLSIKSTSGPMTVIPPDIAHPSDDRQTHFGPHAQFQSAPESLFSSVVIPAQASTLTLTYPLLDEFRPVGMGPFSVSTSFTPCAAEFNNQITASNRFFKATLQTDPDGSQHYRSGNFTFGNLTSVDYENQYFGERYLAASQFVPTNGSLYYSSSKPTLNWHSYFNSPNAVSAGPIKKLDGTNWTSSILQNDIPGSGLKFDVEVDAINPRDESQFFFTVRRRIADTTPPANYTNVAFSTAMVALPDRAMNPSEIYIEEPKAHVKVSAIQKTIANLSAQLDLTFQAHDQFLSFVPVNQIDSDSVNVTVVGPNSVGDITHSDFQGIALNPIPLANQGLNRWERDYSLPNRHLSEGSLGFTVFPGRTRIHVHYTGVVQQESHAIYEVELLPNNAGQFELTWIQVSEELFPEPLGAVFFQGIRHHNPFVAPPTQAVTMSVTTPTGSRSVSLSRFFSSSHFVSEPYLPISPQTAAKLPGSVSPLTLEGWPILVIDENSTVSGSFGNDSFNMTSGDSLYFRGWHNNQAQTDDLELYDSFKIFLRTSEENLGNSVDVYISNYNFGGQNWITLTRSGNSTVFESEVIDLKNDPNLAAALNAEYGLSIEYQGLIAGTSASNIKRTKIDLGGTKKTSPYEALSGVSPKGGFNNTVELANGEFHYSVPVLAIPQSSGPPLEVVLTYRSQVDYFNSPIAPNWDHNYNQRIRVARDQSGDLEYFNGAGRILRFKKQANPASGAPQWLPPEGFYGLIEKVGQHYQIVTKNGGILYFNYHGQSRYARLEKLEDSHGFAVTVHYGRYGVKRVTDRFGREIAFNYHSSSDPNNLARVNEIKDSIGRVVKLGQYNSTTTSVNAGLIGDLAYIRLPTTTQHPDGFAWSFKYRTQDPAPHDHNLIAIYDPLGTQVTDKSLPSNQWTWSPIESQAILVNEYGPHGSALEDRVVKQRYGRPQLTGSADPGGTYDFDYTNTTTKITHPKGTETDRTEETYTFDKVDGNGVLIPTPSKREVVDNQLNKTLVWTFLYNEDHENTETVFPLGKKVVNRFYRSQITDTTIQAWALSRGNITEAKTITTGISDGPRVFYIYDRSSRDPRGTKKYNTVHISRRILNQSQQLRTDYTYNDFGDLETSTTDVTAIEISGVGSEETQTLVTINEYYPASADAAHRYRLKAVNDTEGNITSFKYDANGYLKEVSKGLSTQNTHPLQTSGLQIATPEQKTSYEYDSLGYKIKETSPRGVSTTFTVNTYGQVTAMLRAAEVSKGTDHAHKYKTEYFYNELGLIEHVITENRWPTDNKMPKPVEFDDEHYKHLDNIHQYFEYDALGRNTEVRRQQLHPGSLDGTGSLSAYAVSINEYNGAGQVTCTKTPMSDSASVISVESDNVTFYEYNWRGQVIKSYKTGPAATSLTTVNKYNEHGLLFETQSPDGITTINTFDLFDRLEEVSKSATFNNNQVNPNWQKTKYKYDRGGRLVESSICGKGGFGPDQTLKKTTTVYDELDRPTSETQHVITMSDTENLTTKRRYNAHGQVIVEQDPKGQLTSYVYNSKQQMIRSLFPMVNPLIIKTWTFDHIDFEFAEETTQEFLDGVTPCTDPLKTRYFFDEFDQVVEKLDPKGGRSLAVYDSRGQIVAETDQRGPRYTPGNPDSDNRPGFPTFTLRDGLGNAVKVVTLDGGSVTIAGVTERVAPGDLSLGSIDQTRYMKYDKNSRLVMEGVVGGKVKTVEYDQYNRPTAVTSNNQTKSTNWRSDSNQIDYVINENGDEQSFEYDELGHIKKVTVNPRIYSNSDFDLFVKGTAGYHCLDFELDGLGRITKTETTDPRLGIFGANPANWNSYAIKTQTTFDGLGRVTSEFSDLTNTAVHEERTIFRQYNNLLLSRVDYSSGLKVDHEQDTYGRLTRIKSGYGSIQSVVATFNWCGATKLKDYSQLNENTKKIVTRFTYNKKSGNLESKSVTRHQAQRPAEELLVQNYKYDRSNNLKFEETEHKVGQSNRISRKTYEYDVVNRLRNIGADSHNNQAPLGTQNTNSQYQYYTDGKLLCDNHFFYRYDAQGRLSEVWTKGIPALIGAFSSSPFSLWGQDPKLVKSIHYDGLGRRFLEIVYDLSDTTTVPQTNIPLPKILRTVRYTYKGTQPIEVFSTTLGGSETLSARHIFGPGGIIEAEFWGPTEFLDGSTSKRVFVHRDANNNPVMYTENNVVIQRNTLSSSGVLLKIEDEFFGNISSSNSQVPLNFIKGNLFREREVAPSLGGNRGTLLTLFSKLHNQFRDADSPIFDLLVSTHVAVVDFDEQFRQLDTFTNFARNGFTGAWDGVAQVATFGLYEGQLMAELFGADPSSYAYLGQRIINNIIGDIVLSFFGGPAFHVGEIAGGLYEAWRGYQNGSWVQGSLGLFSAATGATGLRAAYKTAAQGVKAAKNSVRAGRSLPMHASSDVPMTPGACFLAGTKVLTKNGRKNIEDIKVGDEVLSRNDKTGEQDYKKVARLFRGSTKKVVHLKVQKSKRLKKARTERHSVGQRAKGKSSEGDEDGDGAGDSAGDPDSEQYLRCTEEHPFWVKGKGWVNAKDLRQGDKLRGSNGEELEVSGHEIKDEEADHYNFEVQDFHTYFVSGSDYDSDPGVWVHNMCQGANQGRRVRAAASKLGLLRQKQGLKNVPLGVGEDPGFFTVTLNRLPGMPLESFNRKTSALQALGNEGALRRMAPGHARALRATDTELTVLHKQYAMQNIWNQYGDRPEIARRLTDTLFRPPGHPNALDVDHIWELGLGGPHVEGNLRLLNQFTNRNIGMFQIPDQLRAGNVPVGTRIQIAIQN